MKEKLNILLIGSGCREAAIAASIAESPRCAMLFCAFPDISGNREYPGKLTDAAEIPDFAEYEEESDFRPVADFCKSHDVDMVVVGPPEPIAAGITDYLEDFCESTPGMQNLRVIAPTAEAARLESSKEFAKDFMAEAGIPSPRYMPVDADTLDEGLSFIESLPAPYVIKADGLANGAGVLIINDKAEAKDALEDMVRGLFGPASSKVLIEEYVSGRECSIMAAVDGSNYILLPPARDFKRLLDGGFGPNTPGMGAYSPVESVDDEFIAKVVKRIINPTFAMLAERGIKYKGFLYFGIMDIDGEPILLEYNVRLGDPEAQAVLPRISSDMISLLEGIAEEDIEDRELHIDNLHHLAITVLSGSRRVMTVVGDGPDLRAAAESAYAKADALDIPDIHYRRDIGSK